MNAEPAATPTLEHAVVTLREEVLPGVWKLRLHSPRIAAAGLPGQFVHIQCAQASDPLLRRPFSFADIDDRHGTFDLLFNVTGQGTAILAAAEAGQAFEVLGPLGHTFTLPERGELMVVAGGLGIAPFPLVLRLAAAQGAKVHWRNGAYTAHQLYPIDLLPAGVDPVVATDDGSAGRRGTIVELLAATVVDWIDAVQVIHACGPMPMLASLARLLRDLDGRANAIPACEMSLEAPMGCALGTCLGCVVPSTGFTSAADGSRAMRLASPGFARVCVEGAVMDWRAVDWDRVESMGELIHHRGIPDRLDAGAVVVH